MKKSLNIVCLVQNNPFCQSGAGANRLRGLIEGLVECGVTINLLIYGGIINKQEKLQWKSKGIKHGVHYEYLSSFVQDSLWKNRFYKYFFSKLEKLLIRFKMLDILNKRDGIVWVSNDLFVFKILNQLSKEQQNFKVFIEISEYLDFYKSQSLPVHLNFEFKKHEQYFKNVFVHQLDGIALMTNNLFVEFQANIGAKYLHLPMTVDLKRFEQDALPLEEFSSPYIAYIGAINDAKDGVSILIKAFNIIKNNYPFHKLYLVGSWNYDTPVHMQLIKENKLEDRVFWMKEYSRDKIPNIICNADLLTLPRPDSKQAQGGFPTKLGEYLATGVPVCATMVGEIPDYLTDNESVFFAEPGSVNSFANAMERALSNLENAKNVGAKGREVANLEFNKDIQSKKLFEFLRGL